MQTASDKRIGERKPFHIAREIALQRSRIGQRFAGGKSSPQQIHGELMEELQDLVDPEWAERMIRECSRFPALRYPMRNRK